MSGVRSTSRGAQNGAAPDLAIRGGSRDDRERELQRSRPLAEPESLSRETGHEAHCVATIGGSLHASEPSSVIGRGKGTRKFLDVAHRFLDRHDARDRLTPEDLWWFVTTLTEEGVIP